MYDFHYNFIKKKFDAELLFTDTESLTYICWIKDKDVLYKTNDGKECNTAKGVNVATEFDKLKDVLFNKKIIRHKMKRIQSKKHK